MLSRPLVGLRFILKIFGFCNLICHIEDNWKVTLLVSHGLSCRQVGFLGEMNIKSNVESAFQFGIIFSLVSTAGHTLDKAWKTQLKPQKFC